MMVTKSAYVVDGKDGAAAARLRCVLGDWQPGSGDPKLSGELRTRWNLVCLLQREMSLNSLINDATQYVHLW